MKKLMIAAAIVFAAVVSNAATMSWSVMSLKGPDGQKAGTGWLVELYATSIAFDVEKAQKGLLDVGYTSTTVAQGTTATRAGETGLKKPDGTDYVAGDTADYYLVIWDNADKAEAGKYIVSDSRKQTVTAAGSPITLNYGNMAATTAANNAFYGKEWKSIPEPTSALLMLLGVAGLALRRRRA